MNCVKYSTVIKITALFATLLLSVTFFCLSACALPGDNDTHIINPDTEILPVTNTVNTRTSAPLVYSGDNDADEYSSSHLYSGEVKQPDDVDDPGVGGLGEAPVIEEESEFLNALKTAAPFVFSGAVAAFVTIKLLHKRKQ